MARIPLRDIPNAPGVVAQPTGGNLPRVNLGAAQSLLQQPTISPDAFQGEARGLQTLAAGIGSVAGAADKFQKAALHLQDIVDEDKRFKGKQRLLDHASISRQEMEAMPEDYAKWGEIVQRNMKEGYEGFLAENKDLSPRARRLFEEDYTAMSRELYGRAQEMGVRKATDNVRKGVFSEARMLAESGDMEGSVARLEEERGRGRLSDVEINEGVKTMRDLAGTSNLEAMRATRPDLAMEYAKDAEKTPWLSPQRRAQEVQRSRVAMAHRDGELMDAIYEAVDSGEVKSLEDAAKHFGEEGPGFVHRNRPNLKRAVAERKYSDTGAARKVIQELRAMEIPADEMNRRELRTEMKTRLRSVLLPADYEDWKGALDQEFDGEDRKPALKRISKMNESMVAAGYFGKTFDEKKADEGDVEEMRKRDEARKNVDTVDRHMSEWLRDNPRASDEEAMAEYQTFLTNSGWVPTPAGSWWITRKAKSLLGISEEKEFWQQTKEERAKQYKEAGEREYTPRGKSSSAEGDRVTSYGYANDSTPDRNSRDGIGAWVSDEEQRRIRAGLPSEKRLRPGDIAVSPDVEKRMRAAGVKPEDEVRVLLADGTEHVGRWMDRTAKAYNGKPLRGRIDLYSPDGVHAKDGVAVVGWEKA